MTKSSALTGCGLIIAAVSLFFASFVVAFVENFCTGKLFAAHPPLWVLLGALTFVTLGAAIGLTVEPHVTRGRQTLGHVIAIQPGSDPTEDEPKVVVRYEVDGATHEFVSNSVFRAKVGDTLPVSYLPDDPANASVRNQVRLYLLLSLVSLGLGSLWVVIWSCGGG